MLLISLQGCGPSAQHLETVTGEEGDFHIPYEKYQLENGLTVIVHEDHSDPLVHVDVTYHVGSAREELGRSGFAHFFEHMMFQGSQHVGDEQHFKIVTESGGTLNGTTNRDRTNYYQTVPSDQLERMLWLESDRMGFLLEAVTQEKFEIQRATVKNEKAQNYDNKPYGPYQELAAETLYPHGHPYSWLTIGKVEDLDLADVDDLKKFFLRWYGPNNATLTVGGDVEAKAVVALAKKYFGPIPKGPGVEPLQIDPVSLDTDRYVSYYDRNIRFPALIYKFPTVPRYHGDEPALDCLAKILGQGKTSYLYKTFVEEGRAIQANTSHPCSELAGEFSMFVVPYPGKSLPELEGEVAQAMQEFDIADIKDTDIQKFKTGVETRMIAQLGTVQGKVSLLAAHETFRNDPKALAQEMERYKALTKEDVVRAYDTYIKDRPSVLVSILAEEDGLPAQADNFVPETGNNPYPVTDYTGLQPREVQDDLDRNKMPKTGTPPVVKVPEFWSQRLENGMRVIGAKHGEIPAVSLRLELYGGHLYDTAFPGRAGVAALTAALMNEGTQERTASGMAAALEELGSSISVSATDDATVITLWTLKKNLDPTLELLRERLFLPEFAESDFDRLKKQQWEGAKAREQQPQGIASTGFGKLLYGPGHILAVPVEGFPETIAEIGLEDVHTYYEEYYAPDHAKLVVVGDVEADQVLKKLSFLDQWAPKLTERIEVAAPVAAGPTKIYLIDRQGATQSEIRMGHPTPLRYDPTGTYYKAVVMNYPLGGAFNSRINLNLREDKGYTYGASSGFSSDADTGFFSASASVKSEATAAAITEFLTEIKNYRASGITQEELAFAQRAIGRGEALKYETLGQKASFLDKIVSYGLERDFKSVQREVLEGLTEAELDALAREQLRPDEMVILVVGDKAANWEALHSLGLEVVELDPRGNPLQ